MSESAHTSPRQQASSPYLTHCHFQQNLGGVFWQTVVLMLDVERNGKGATGLVVNRPLKGTLKDVARKGSNVAKTVQSAFSSSTCTYGGPVQPEDLAVLHANPYATGAREVRGSVSGRTN